MVINKQLVINQPQNSIQPDALDTLYNFFNMFLYSNIQVPDRFKSNELNTELPFYNIISKQENITEQYQYQQKELKEEIPFDEQILEIQKQNKIYNQNTIPGQTYEQNEITEINKIIENEILTDNELQILKQQEAAIDIIQDDNLIEKQDILDGDKVRKIEIDVSKDQLCPIATKYYKEEFDTYALYQ